MDKPLVVKIAEKMEIDLIEKQALGIIQEFSIEPKVSESSIYVYFRPIRTLKNLKVDFKLKRE